MKNMTRINVSLRITGLKPNGTYCPIGASWYFDEFVFDSLRSLGYVIAVLVAYVDSMLESVAETEQKMGNEKRLSIEPVFFRSSFDIWSPPSRYIFYAKGSERYHIHKYWLSDEIGKFAVNSKLEINMNYNPCRKKRNVMMLSDLFCISSKLRSILLCKANTHKTLSKLVLFQEKVTGVSFRACDLQRWYERTSLQYINRYICAHLLNGDLPTDITKFITHIFDILIHIYLIF